MKLIVSITLALVSQIAFGAEPGQPKKYLNPAKFSENRQKCNLITGVISIVPIWRDNQVPVKQAHRNVEEVLVKVEALESDKPLWHRAVDRLYASKVSSKEMEAELRPMCEEIPQHYDLRPKEVFGILTN